MQVLASPEQAVQLTLQAVHAVALELKKPVGQGFAQVPSGTLRYPAVQAAQFVAVPVQPSQETSHATQFVPSLM